VTDPIPTPETHAPGSDATPWWKRYAKAVAAFLATLSPQAVAALLVAAGITDPTLTYVIAGLVSVLAGTVAVRQVPNAERTPAGHLPGESRPGS
jgi:ABC-type thiamine transport system ATPase subunit